MLQLWHGDPDKVLMYFWDGLHVGGQYLGMSREVDKEGVTCPLALHFHYLKWCAPQQAFKGGPDADAMTLTQVEAGLPCSCCHCPDELRLGERVVFSVFVKVCKQVSVWGWVVECHVACKGCLRICVS